MKTRPCLLALLLALTPGAYAATPPSLITLDGQPATESNPPSGRVIKEFHQPVIHLLRTETKPAMGTVLVLPGGGYRALAISHEGRDIAAYFNGLGYDAAILEYHISTESSSRPQALTDALTAWELLDTKAAALGLSNTRLDVIGFSAGGHLAAALTQALAADGKRQPDDLILVYPAYLQEKDEATGTLKVTPPAKPTGRVFAVIATDDVAPWVPSTRAYVEAWQQAGGTGEFHLLTQGKHGYGLKPQPAESGPPWPQNLTDFVNAAGK